MRQLMCYLRYPHVAGDLITFAAEDDVWLALLSEAAGGRGTRAWRLDLKYELVDGTLVAQPKYAWWFAGVGWAVENHGVDPDVEVTIAPHDWAAGRDPQLDTAVRLALQALEQRPPAAPPTV